MCTTRHTWHSIHHIHSIPDIQNIYTIIPELPYTISISYLTYWIPYACDIWHTIIIYISYLTYQIHIHIIPESPYTISISHMTYWIPYTYNIWHTIYHIQIIPDIPNTCTYHTWHITCVLGSLLPPGWLCCIKCKQPVNSSWHKCPKVTWDSFFPLCPNSLLVLVSLSAVLFLTFLDTIVCGLVQCGAPPEQAGYNAV